ncbi:MULTISPECIES: SCO family protein [unclassified Thioalkalivibrio]|uniref:SCO family protein n=1 Tax=unclassified Thioalkalivibrio TaxID=2621013 RepID=UPI000369AD7A|nr:MULTISPECIES: SCO family protein [unclassified Thioalkalivibrio]
MNRIPVSSLFWAFAVVAAGALLVYVTLEPGEPPPRDLAGHAQLPIADEVQGGPIELPVATHAERFDLGDYTDQYVWLYFGYTSCPDACPTSLGWIGGALNRLPEELQGQVNGVFISVDPERDTEDRLADYVAHFHADIHAATGSEEDLKPAAKRYGVFYERRATDSAMGDIIDHSSSTYLIGPEGDLLEIHPHGTSAADLVETLRAHAQSQGTDD